jgi:hypothetical protein
VNGKDVRAGFAELLQIILRPLNHQVDINRQVRQLADGRHDGHAIREVGNERAIHDVQVESGHARFLQKPHFPLQIAEVAKEERREHSRHGMPEAVKGRRSYHKWDKRTGDAIAQGRSCSLSADCLFTVPFSEWRAPKVVAWTFFILIAPGRGVITCS